MRVKLYLLLISSNAPIEGVSIFEVIFMSCIICSHQDAIPVSLYMVVKNSEKNSNEIKELTLLCLPVSLTAIATVSIGKRTVNFIIACSVLCSGRHVRAIHM